MYFEEKNAAEMVAEMTKMTKKDFHKIIKNVARTPEFAKIINFGIDSLTKKEVDDFIDVLEKNGLKKPSENDLLPIIQAIADRAASYR